MNTYEKTVGNREKEEKGLEIENTARGGQWP
jgi:hypothetical protein